MIRGEAASSKLSLAPGDAANGDKGAAVSRILTDLVPSDDGLVVKTPQINEDLTSTATSIVQRSGPHVSNDHMCTLQMFGAVCNTLQPSNPILTQMSNQMNEVANLMVDTLKSRQQHEKEVQSMEREARKRKIRDEKEHLGRLHGAREKDEKVKRDAENQHDSRMRLIAEEDARKKAELTRIGQLSEAVQASRSMDSSTRKIINERLLAVDDPTRQHLRDTASSIGGVIDASLPRYTALEWHTRLFPGEELKGMGLKALSMSGSLRSRKKNDPP